MSFDILIDGYNLLHALGLALPKYAAGQFERRRQQLVARLRRLLPPRQLERTTVVFDGRDDLARDARTSRPSGAASSMTALQDSRNARHGPRVLFSRGAEKADDVLEALLARHPSPRRVVMVSSDHRLHRAAARRGAVSLDCDAFLDRLEAQRAAERRTSEMGAAEDDEAEDSQEFAEDKPQNAGPVDDWLKFFASGRPESAPHHVEPSRQRPEELQPDVQQPEDQRPTAAGGAAGRSEDTAGSEDKAASLAPPRAAGGLDPSSVAETARPSASSTSSVAGASAASSAGPVAGSDAGAQNLDELRFWEERLRNEGLLPDAPQPQQPPEGAFRKDSKRPRS